mgnify:FL=1
MPSGGEMLFTDTVGFIQKLPHSLVTSFRATLEETAFADVILHIQDASSRKRTAQAQTVCRIITDLQAQHIPVIDVFNKADLLSPARAELLRAQNPHAVFISAANGAHLQTLLRRVEQAISYKWQVRTLTLRADQLNKIGAIYEKSLVIHQTPQADGGLQLTVMATVGNYQSLQKHLN